MKQIIAALALSFATPFLLSAQETKEFTVDGIKVIYKKTAKETITATLCVRGGTANYPENQQGIEPLALHTALLGGTPALNRDAFAEQAEIMGTEFYESSAKDYSSMNMVCLKDNFDKSWTMFTDAIAKPVMDEQEFEIYKSQMLSGAKQQESNPDTYLRRLASDQIYHGTDYLKNPNGLPNTIEGLTLDQAKAHYSKLLGKKRMYLVVVGNVTEAELTTKIRSTLGKLPEGTPAPVPTYQAKWNTAPAVSDRKMATNYVIGQIHAPKYNSADGPAFQFASSILYDRYFVELRTKRSLSYAPAAGYSRGTVQSPTAFFYISTIDPKQSLQVMTDILSDVRQNGFTAKEIADKKKEFLTSYYMGNEASRDQAAALASCEAAGDWRLFDSLNDRVGKLDARKLNETYRKYLSDTIAWTYLGDSTKVSTADFKQLQPVKPSAAQNRVQAPAQSPATTTSPVAPTR